MRKVHARFAVERMFRIHGLLLAGKQVTARRVAEDLECSFKTVGRDLEFMRDRLRLPLVYRRESWTWVYDRSGPKWRALQIKLFDSFGAARQ